MSTETKTKLVPKLRFPEFRGTAAWEKTTIGHVCKSFSGGTPTTSQKEFYGGSIPFIRSAEIARDVTELFLTDEGLKKSAAKLIDEGDVLVALYGANSGDVALAKIAGAINQAILCLKSDSSNAYIYQLLHHKQSWITSTYIQGGQGNLSGDIVKSILIPLPTATEQKKIADCLSSLDELLAAQGRKVEALKTYKKGLMQQLFPREGETQPRLRFPEFEASADWESKRLEDLARRGSGHTPSKSKPEYYEGDIKWVSLADSKRLDAGLIYETATSISAQGIKNSSAVLHPAGTVLISRDAGVGKSAVMATPMAVSQHFIVWTCHDQLLSNWFLYYVLQEMKPIFETNATGSTIKTIGLPFFKELQIAVPSLPEQKRIADCLASLDTLITAATQELDNLKTYKKGLMQQLFPSFAEN